MKDLFHCRYYKRLFHEHTQTTVVVREKVNFLCKSFNPPNPPYQGGFCSFPKNILSSSTFSRTATVKMKKLFHCPLFSLVVFFFSACDPYTVENGYTERISAGSVVILPAQCVELFHFPLLGDFPLQFRYADRNLISPEDQSPGHYFISSGGEVLKRERPCAKDFSVLSSASKPVPVGFRTECG